MTRDPIRRGLHQLGLVHLAQPLYERCLEGDSSRGAVPLRCQAGPGAGARGPGPAPPRLTSTSLFAHSVLV